MAIGVMTRLDDLERVIQETSRHRDRVLESVAAKWPEWSVKVHKAKAIYNMMNQVRGHTKLFVKKVEFQNDLVTLMSFLSQDDP